MKKIFLIILILTILSVAAGWFYYQRNVFSQDILRFEIIAPEIVDLGEEVEYMIRYKNNGDIRLEEASILFEYPRNSFYGEEDEDVIKRGEFRREIFLGDINPGEEGNITFSARLFGKEGTAVTASSWITYRPKNLNVRYETKREHTAVIGTVPITFEFEIPSTVEPEKDTFFRLRYFSNIDYPLTNLEMRMRYPSGFSFVRSTPESGEENQWSIPVLNRAEGGVIEVVGSLEGEPREPKVFSATLGMWNGNTFIPIKEISRGTSISMPSLFISVQANNSPQYVADPGELIYYEVFFKNIGTETMENLFMMIQLDRDVIDFDDVEPMNGRFQKEAGSMIWNHALEPQMRSLASGEEGKISFWVRIKDDLPRNPESKMTIVLDRAREEFSTKVNTELYLSQKVVTDNSPFESIGPFPFEEGVTSSYVVMFEAENYYTDVRDVSVKATLPPGARITGKVSPEDQSISFDSQTGEVVWSMDTLQGGTGVLRPSKKIFFEVIITPFADVNELISEAVIIGEDVRTEREVRAKVQPITIEE